MCVVNSHMKTKVIKESKESHESDRAYVWRFRFKKKKGLLDSAGGEVQSQEMDFKPEEKLQFWLR